MNSTYRIIPAAATAGLFTLTESVDIGARPSHSEWPPISLRQNQAASTTCVSVKVEDKKTASSMAFMLTSIGNDKVIEILNEAADSLFSALDAEENANEAR